MLNIHYQIRGLVPRLTWLRYAPRIDHPDISPLLHMGNVGVAADDDLHIIGMRHLTHASNAVKTRILMTVSQQYAISANFHNL